MDTKGKDRKVAIEHLQSIVRPGDTLYTKLNHVSRSGMYRVIDIYLIKDNEPQRISFSVAQAIGSRYDKVAEGVGVRGCGMDMGFHIVYNLSHCLFPDGFGCIGENCPSNDHSNGDRDYTPNGGIVHGMEQEKDNRTHWHKEGGYALRHRWL
jgi:hypothetical protein